LPYSEPVIEPVILLPGNIMSEITPTDESTERRTQQRHPASVLCRAAGRVSGLGCLGPGPVSEGQGLLNHVAGWRVSLAAV
jgi:hypothetical protein